MLDHLNLLGLWLRIRLMAKALAQPQGTGRLSSCCTGKQIQGGTVLGGSGVPTCRAMYIARYDQALRLILKSMAKGDHGGYCTTLGMPS